MSKFLIVFVALFTSTAVMAATKKPAAPAAGQFCYHRTVLSGAGHEKGAPQSARVNRNQ